jgi:hypothetical protein
MPKAMQDEIDTILETEEGVAAKSPAQQLEALSAEISLGSELESSKMEISQAAALPEKTFFFNDFPPKVYCTLTGIGFIQIGEGRGIAYFTFTQICNSRRSDVAKGPDWASASRFTTFRTPSSATSISAIGAIAAGSTWSSLGPTSIGCLARSIRYQRAKG